MGTEPSSGILPSDAERLRTVGSVWKVWGLDGAGSLLARALRSITDFGTNFCRKREKRFVTESRVLSRTRLKRLDTDSGIFGIFFPCNKRSQRSVRVFCAFLSQNQSNLSSGGSVSNLVTDNMSDQIRYAKGHTGGQMLLTVAPILIDESPRGAQTGTLKFYQGVRSRSKHQLRRKTQI